MNIKNEMEHLVSDEVARVKNQGAGESRGCWCLLCETDITALALTLLPPLYCRTETYGHAGSLIKAGKIQDAVQTAIQRVGLRPKHRPGFPGARRGDVALVNYSFEIGAEMLNPSFNRADVACGCSCCRADALAYALNRYPTKYGVTQGGSRNLLPTYANFMRHELGLLLDHATRFISAHPHH